MRHDQIETLAALPTTKNGCSTLNSSVAARRRLLSVKGEPLFYADWLRVLFIHFEVDAGALQREVPFPLDLREGRATSASWRSRCATCARASVGSLRH
jgi:hypothetical protein